jgi:ABC-2 type transport system ATP-binding protein
MPNEVEIVSLCKSYGKKIACDGINFSAEKNSITGILGKNGAGKSTLLKSLCGIHYPSSGTVKIGGNSDFNVIRKKVAFVPEIPQLDMRLTVKETLFFEAEISCVPAEKIPCVVENAVSVCGLEKFFFAKINSLSRGFRQRTSLAKALCKNPEVLVLDEFSAGLDPEQISIFRGELKKISKSSTVIFSTHRVEDASSLCRKIYFLCGGKICAEGSEGEILKSSSCINLEEAFIKICGEKK